MRLGATASACRPVTRRVRTPRGLRSITTTIRSPDSSSTSFDTVDVTKFRDEVFQSGRPWLFKNDDNLSGKDYFFPASFKWFDSDGSRPPGHYILSNYMRQFADHVFPFEFHSHQPSEKDGTKTDVVTEFLNWLISSPDYLETVLAGVLHSAIQQQQDGSGSGFCTLEAPLVFLLKALEFNQGREKPLRQVYVAQSQLPDLPTELQQDLPTPPVVREAGKGDVYNSSIWMGLEPTYTPLHRDPNPNLFCQLQSHKTVRLMPPETGDQLYREVQTRLGLSGSSRIRGYEMMEGPERVILNAAVWGAEPPKDMVEARLEAGDALFIPTGWWHSVRSTQSDGRLNASVNWWFR